MDYSNNSFTLYEVDFLNCITFTRCNIAAANPGHPAVTPGPRTIGEFPDGLHWTTAGTLWASSETFANNWVAEVDTITCAITGGGANAFNPPLTGGLGTSGIAFDGIDLWHAANGALQIYRTAVTGGPKLTLFPDQIGYEDMEFDPITFAPLCALWGNSPFQVIGAHEIPCPVIVVDIDIKFCSDPNGFNCKSNGKTPVTIFGSSSLDVNDIDISSLQLCEAGNLANCTGAPLDWSVFDRGDPTTDLGAAMCAIDPTTGEELDWLNPDGFDDLDVAFGTQEVVGVIGCDGLAKGDTSLTLVLVGQTNGGIPITSVAVGDVGIDQLLIQKN